MNDTEVELLGIVIDLSVNLLAVSLTLIALIPTLLELIRGRAPDFISQIEEENALDKVMYTLTATVLLFGVSLLSGLVGKFCEWMGFLWITTGTFLIGLVIIITVSIYTANMIRSYM